MGCPGVTGSPEQVRVLLPFVLPGLPHVLGGMTPARSCPSSVGTPVVLFSPLHLGQSSSRCACSSPNTGVPLPCLCPPPPSPPLLEVGLPSFVLVQSSKQP